MKEELINELLEKLKQCDDYHNRCDFLMEHDEITYMLDYITNLQKENEELKEELQERLNKAIEYIEDNVAVYAFGNKELPHWEFDDNNIQDLLKILKGED